MVAHSDALDRLHEEEGTPRNRLAALEKAETCFDPWSGSGERGEDLTPGWGALTEALRQFAAAVTERREEFARMKAVEEKVRTLSAKVEELEEKCGHPKELSCGVPIQTFAPEPFVLIKPILVSIEESDDEYIASFFDANISAQGDTRQEAIDNLKDLLLSRFDYLDNLTLAQLGKSLKRQIAVLREFIRRSE